jgi:hypothetical protein
MFGKILIVNRGEIASRILRRLLDPRWPGRASSEAGPRGLPVHGG